VIERRARALLALGVSAAMACGPDGEVSPDMNIEPPPPILEGYTADPHAVVFDGVFYVYPTSDNGNWQTTEFSAWSSTDLVHWKKDGLILDVATDLRWAKVRAWAPAMIRRDGRYFFYFAAEQQIGVAVADKPVGKFVDPLGKPLITPSSEHPGQVIDPFAFIDDDGQAYLYYGQGNLYAYKLAPDMITLDGPATKMTPPHFNEGVFMIKRRGVYYFMWSENDAPAFEHPGIAPPQRLGLAPIAVEQHDPLNIVKQRVLIAFRFALAVEHDDLAIGRERGYLGGAEIKDRPALRIDGAAENLGEARPRQPDLQNGMAEMPDSHAGGAERAVLLLRMLEDEDLDAVVERDDCVARARCRRLALVLVFGVRRAFLFHAQRIRLRHRGFNHGG